MQKLSLLFILCLAYACQSAPPQPQLDQNLAHHLRSIEMPERVLEIDLNGDGQKEKLALYANQEGLYWETVSGQRFDLPLEGPAESLLLWKNLGDLDGDGGEELAYVPNYEDNSSINHFQIVSWKKGWKTPFRFEIREDQIKEDRPFVWAKGKDRFLFRFVNEEGLEEYQEAILDQTNAPDKSLPLEKRFVCNGDMVRLPAFSFTLKLTAGAQKILDESPEELVLSILLHNEPSLPLAADMQKYWDEDMEYLLLLQKEKQQKSTAFLVDDLELPRAALEACKNLNMQLELNMYTARKTSENNLLSIDPLFDGLLKLRTKKIILKGRVI